MKKLIETKKLKTLSVSVENNTDRVFLLPISEKSVFLNSVSVFDNSAYEKIDISNNLNQIIDQKNKKKDFKEDNKLNQLNFQILTRTIMNFIIMF